MKADMIERIRSELNQFGDPEALIGKPATSDEIANAEKKLNITFADQYIEFIKIFGGAFGGIAIAAFHNGSMIGNETVIDLTLSFRKAYGDYLGEKANDYYMISDDGSGNPILMNTQGNVFLYLHEEGELELIYNSLEDLWNQSFPEKNPVPEEPEL